MSARESIVARKILGTVILAALAASALGIAPAALIPFKAPTAQAQVTSANITELTTSRDAFGTIFNNTVTLLKARFADYVVTSVNGTIDITFRLLTEDRSVALCAATISLTPAASGDQVLFYNTSLVVNNSGIFYGNHSTGNISEPVATLLTNGTQINATQICSSYDATNIPSKAIFQFVDATVSPARVLKELVYKHTEPSLVPGNLSVTRTMDNVTVVFNISAPDLNAFWNSKDSVNGINFTVKNTTFTGPSGLLTLNETGENTGIFTGSVTLNISAAGLTEGAAYNLSLRIPIHRNLTYDGVNNDTVNITFTVPPIPEVTVKVDWLEKYGYIPATVDNNLVVGITITDPTAGSTGPTPVLNTSLFITFLNYLGQPVKTNVPLTNLFPSVTNITGVALYTSTTYVELNAPLIFQYPFEVVGGSMVVTYKSQAGDFSVSVPIRAVDVSLTINGTQSLQGFYGQAIEVTLVNPAASFNLSEVNSVSLVVVGATMINGSPVGTVSSITLRENSPGSGVFTGLLLVGDDANISADPLSTITFSYVHNASASTPAGATQWVSQTVVASFRLTTEPPRMLSPADGMVTGPAGTINVTIQDPNVNRRIFSPDTVAFSMKRWDGSVVQLQATETGPSTGIFTAIIDKSQIGSPDVILVGGFVQIVYTQPLTVAGPVTLTATVRFVSVDAGVMLDKTAYNPGEIVTITVEDDDIGVTTATVQVVSTSDSTGVQVTLTQAGPGTRPGTVMYKGSITVSNITAVRGDPRFIYANVGDTITVSYRDPFPADYATTRAAKTFTATAFVGVLLEKPVSISISPTLTFVNGTPAPMVVTGQQYLVSYNLTNNNPATETFTAIFQVLSPEGTPVQIVVHVVTLGPGQSTTLADSVIFAAPGSYTIKILVVKSLTDLTPRGDPASIAVSVSSG